MRFTHVAPMALVALLTTSCMSPPQNPDRGPLGGDHVIEEIEASVRASGPATAPPRGLIDDARSPRRLPPPPRYTAPAATSAPASSAPAPSSGAPGSARSYIERHQNQR